MKSVLSGKNAFITGASGGLGKEIAESLASLGANLFLVAGSSTSDVENLSSSLSKKYSNQKFFSCAFDLTNISQIDFLTKKAEESMGSIDILVNCAGIFPVGSLEESDIELIEKCFQVNVIAPFVLSRNFSSKMKEKGWGRIVNIGSSSAYAGFPNTSVYCSSKHALLGLSRSLFQELKNFGIRCICISPGSIKTEMGKSVVGQDYDTFIDPKELAKCVAEITSLDGNMILEEIRVNRMFVQ
tara:strand:+ start:4294 stop:5019 length:726 start_codon:yes stop_codon:yes gene_type:complete